MIIIIIIIIIIIMRKTTWLPQYMHNFVEIYGNIYLYGKIYITVITKERFLTGKTKLAWEA